ncbi:MAG: GNAT family N-acetyltransferase [Blastocatellia bacterium]
MNQLTIETYRGVQAFETLRDEWRELFIASAAPPFLSWEWMTAWQRQFGGEVTPLLICARAADGQLAGLLALGEQVKAGQAGVRVRRLAFLGEGEGAADYLDVLARPGCEQACARAIFEHLASENSFDLLELDGIAADSPNLPMLMWCFDKRTDYRLELQPRWPCPRLQLADDEGEVINRSPRGREFQRNLRKLQKLPGFEHRAVTDADEAPEAFERFLSLHQASWAGRAEPSAFEHPARQQFHRDLIRPLARAGLLRFEEVWIEGACRASLYAQQSGQSLYFYLSGWQPEWARHSIGFMLRGLVITSAIRRGLRCCDFLRGAEKYKFDWASDSRGTLAVRISSRSVPARLHLLRGQLETTARTLLPQRTISALSRLRLAFGRTATRIAPAPALTEASGS